MSYAQHMRWQKKHPKGTHQPFVFSTGSFWPSNAFLREDYMPYVEECRKIGCDPIECRRFYDHITTTKYPRTAPDYAAMTKAGNL
jgi:hypothetical protein